MSASLQDQLPFCLHETNFAKLGTLYRGKVRDVYAQEDRLILITTDRLSAFDRVLATIPFKGEILNAISAVWFEKTRDIVPNHLLDIPHPNAVVAKKCLPFPVEWVVRGFLAGSLWREYERGIRRTAYGVELPDGLKKNQKFEQPLITPTTKAEYGTHDMPISIEEIIGRHILTRAQCEQAVEVARALFAEGQRHSESRGLLLVDTKYELGLWQNDLTLIDEIHTPDSSRYWINGSYEENFKRGTDPVMLDKENIRRWLSETAGFKGDGPSPIIPDALRIELAQKYIDAFEQLTGKVFNALPTSQLHAQLEQTLKPYSSAKTTTHITR